MIWFETRDTVCKAIANKGDLQRWRQLIFGLAALLSGIGLITLGLTKPSNKKTVPRTQQ